MVPLIGLCAFLSVALLVMAVWQSLSAHRTELEGRIDAIAPGISAFDLRGRNLLRMQNYSSLPFLQRMLEGTPRAERIANELDRAGIRMGVGAYVLISFGLGALLAVGVLFGLPALLPNFAAPVLILTRIVAPIAFLAGLYLPRMWVKRRIRRYRTKFETSLPEALDMICRSLRTGSGLMPAIHNVVEQMEGPIVVEFERLEQGIATGLGIEDAFRELDFRVRSSDLHIVVTAILIQREVGGNLTETLANVTDMMRERVRLRGEIKALVARQVFSTYALAATPPFIVLVLSFIGRQYIQALFDEPAGWIVLGIAGTLELIGFVIVRKIATAPVEV